MPWLVGPGALRRPLVEVVETEVVHLIANNDSFGG
jgi:hypothetical protein